MQKVYTVSDREVLYNSVSDTSGRGESFPSSALKTEIACVYVCIGPLWGQ
jgi:hypothetical protein